jgi:hypothetical protein|tara:strand:+ start:442 stop:780 length:339 start_codon:yes stop_codon:yes gene_type:complete
MKISKSQLKQIIQEELDQVMEEGFFEEWWGDAVGTDKLQSAISGDGEGSDEGGEGPTYVEPVSGLDMPRPHPDSPEFAAATRRHGEKTGDPLAALQHADEVRAKAAASAGNS